MGNKTVMGILAIVILILIIFALQYLPRPPAPDQNSQNGNQSTSQEAPPNPNFVLGEVTKTESGKIFFIPAGNSEKTVILTEETYLVKQVESSEGIKLAPAEFKDFKKSSMIVVYYEQEPENDVYQATKVQIIK